MMYMPIIAFIGVIFAVALFFAWLGAFWARRFFFWEAYDEGYVDGSNYTSGKTCKCSEMESIG